MNKNNMIGNEELISLRYPGVEPTSTEVNGIIFFKSFLFFFAGGLVYMIFKNLQ